MDRPDGTVAVPADGRAPEALRALHGRTAVGDAVAVQAVGRAAARWASRHLVDCMAGAGFVEVEMAAGPAAVGANGRRGRSLADSVRPGLRLLCVGLNPSHDEVLAHVSPAHNENIGFYGTFSFEVASELAELVDGYRPLRPPRP